MIKTKQKPKQNQPRQTRTEIKAKTNRMNRTTRTEKQPEQGNQPKQIRKKKKEKEKRAFYIPPLETNFQNLFEPYFLTMIFLTLPTTIIPELLPS